MVWDKAVTDFPVPPSGRPGTLGHSAYQVHLCTLQSLMHRCWHPLEEVCTQLLKLRSRYLGLKVHVVHQAFNLEG